MLLPKSVRTTDEDSLFKDLISIGENRAHITLPCELHAFLAECLKEHVADPDVVHQVLAFGILEASSLGGEVGHVLLKRTGDGALLLAGLFPERALRLNVSSGYFRAIGQTAYATMSARAHASGLTSRGAHYNLVARNFPYLEKVLNAARGRAATTWDAYVRFRTLLN